MKTLFTFLVITTSLSLFAQTKPVAEKEQRLVDSVVNVMRAKSRQDSEARKSTIDPILKSSLCENLEYGDFLGKDGELYLNITSFERSIYGIEFDLDFPDNFSKQNNTFEEVKSHVEKFRKYWENNNLWIETCSSDDSFSTSYGVYSIPQYIVFYGNKKLFKRLFLSSVYFQDEDIRTKPINAEGETMLQWINRERREKKMGETSLEGLKEIEDFMTQYFTIKEEKLYRAQRAKETLGKVSESIPFDYGYGVDNVPTIKIGTQEWLGKNLNVDHFANGDPIPEAKNESEWKTANYFQRPAWCYYNNDPANGQIYGKLYNWYAVTDPRGLAPKGWHIPDYNDFKTLLDFLGGEEIAGLPMKSTTGWYRNNGNNKSGFNALPGGYRESDASFKGRYLKEPPDRQGYDGNLWSRSTSQQTGKPATFEIFSYDNKVRLEFFEMGCGFPIRCIRD